MEKLLTDWASLLVTVPIWALMFIFIRYYMNNVKESIKEWGLLSKSSDDKLKTLNVDLMGMKKDLERFKDDVSEIKKASNMLFETKTELHEMAKRLDKMEYTQESLDKFVNNIMIWSQHSLQLVNVKWAKRHNEELKFPETPRKNGH